MDPEVATHVAYVLWLDGGRTFDSLIGWRESAYCWR
jgi:hypothetical protein